MTFVFSMGGISFQKRSGQLLFASGLVSLNCVVCLVKLIELEGIIRSTVLHEISLPMEMRDDGNNRYCYANASLFGENRTNKGKQLFTVKDHARVIKLIESRNRFMLLFSVFSAVLAVLLMWLYFLKSTTGLKRRCLMLHRAATEGDYKTLKSILRGSPHFKDVHRTNWAMLINTDVNKLHLSGKFKGEKQQTAPSLRLCQRNTALQSAIFGGSKDHIKCIKLLLMSGASLKQCRLKTFLVSRRTECKHFVLLTKLLLASGYAIVNPKQRRILEEVFLTKYENKCSNLQIFKERNLEFGMKFLYVIEHQEITSGFFKDVFYNTMNVSQLQQLCRRETRLHLMYERPNTNLLHTVSHLPLPSSITRYLLYDVDFSSKKVF